VERQITRAWFPPKDGGTRIKIAFKSAKSGEVLARVIQSSGCAACDRAALDAVQNAKLSYIPTGDADVVFDFCLLWDPALHPRGTSIELSAGKQSPPVVFIKSTAGYLRNCPKCVQLNNDGVNQFLDGNYEVAKNLFEEARQMDPAYEPPAHNLEFLQERH
jgi:hypothetical protein